jgi:hypothetical protein
MDDDAFTAIAVALLTLERIILMFIRGRKRLHARLSREHDPPSSDHH